MDAFRAGNPIHTDEARRAAGDFPLKPWTTEEDEVVRLAEEGYSVDEILPYLPVFRTRAKLLARVRTLRHRG